MSNPTLEILPYATPDGVKHYVPLELYQRVLDNLEKLENADPLNAAIARMEAVPVHELMAPLYAIETRQGKAEEIRSILIAAARGGAALPVTPNAADCGQCADMESEFEDFERAGAAPKP